MKYLALVLLLVGCGAGDRVITETKEICSSDSPPLVLPDEVICRHAPSRYAEVTGKNIKYLCVKQ